MSDSNRTKNIENRIEGAQDELRKDIGALEDKVSPENLKAQARERFDEAKERAKEQAVDGTRQAGEAVRERFDDATERMRHSRATRPSLGLLGLAAVIGAGLLLMRATGRGRGGGGDEGHYTRHPRSEYASRDMPPARTSSYRY